MSVAEHRQCSTNSSSNLPVLRLLLALACALVVIPLVQGQAASPEHVAASPTASLTRVFAVAAIRIDKSDPSARSHIISSSKDSHFRAINVTLKSLLQWAFLIPDTRILGGPAWLDSTKFDIEATSDPSVDEQLHGLNSADGRVEKQKMLQSLLADRFRLKVHQESRELPLYALVVAKNGPNFKPSQINGTTINTSRTEIAVSGSDDTLALLADALARSLGRPVVNLTGLHDRYVLDLKWTPDETPSSRPGISDGNTSDSPSLFTAIQEQLGLKLVSQKGPVSVLVLDNAEMPSEN